MFNDVYGIAGQCAGNFSASVHDDFGSSVIADVLEPILGELSSLRALHEEYNRISLGVDQTLQEARSIRLIDRGAFN